MPLRVLVVDDERPARAKMRRLLGELPDITVVGEADGGRTAVAAIRELAPDVVFLDVQMPELDGFGVIEALSGSRIPHVVFVTAHDEFAVRAFSVHALDYLLKPVEPDRVRDAVERARQAIARHSPAVLEERLERLLQQLDRPSTVKHLERILVTVDTRSFFVPLNQVLWIESARNYVILHVGAEQHSVRGSLGALEERLDPARWVRINRSQIINIDAIAHLESWFHGEYRVLLRDGTRATWSRRYLDRAEAVLGRQF
jgi:two-component system LytT family response regulator